MADRRPIVIPFVIAVALAGFTLIPGPAAARNPIRQSFFAAYPGAVDSRLDDLPSIQGHCGVCHFQFTGAGPRNPYGAALESALPGFPNTDASRQQAMHSIENADADADGYSQLVEITDLVTYPNTPTFPGLTPANVGQASGVAPSDILPYLVPSGPDTQPPAVTVVSPNGGQTWVGGAPYTVTWSAIDNSSVAAVEIFYRDQATEPWTMIAQNLANSGSHTWFVQNTPTAAARVRVVAYDTAGNPGEDASDADFTIQAEPGAIAPTTLRDFHQPGTQPFGADAFQGHTACTDCHGGYDAAVEPGFNWKGSMMAQAMRDPLFKAALTVAEQDASSSGDLCLRCHTPFGWLSGRSTPTGGGQLTDADRDGVSCDFCHRMVDPLYQAGVSPAADEAILAGLLDVPGSHANGQYVVDPDLRRRGPFSDPASPHPFLHSPFHRSSAFCGTCHDVSNPALGRTGPFDYALGPLDQAPDSVNSQVLFPVERTYSEWAHSSFPAGVYAPAFAGNLPDGIVASCQDCHLRDVEGRGCNDPIAPVRADLPLHDMMGGNSWMPTILDQIFPAEVDPAALAAGSARAVSLLQKAALLEVAVTAEADSYRAQVTITNRTGHKLPTGYPEGRRMWLNLVAYDASEQAIFASGSYDLATGTLLHDEDLAIYEAELGISPALAQAIGQSAGTSFHFVLNDSVYKDTRIPPLGFTNAAYATFGGVPVDPAHPGERYGDGQNWDEPTYALPPETWKVVATLYYQTTSKEYVTFLRDENQTDDTGQDFHDLWTANGRAAPVVMISDTTLAPSAVAESGFPPTPLLSIGASPFRQELSLRLHLTSPCRVEVEIYDLQGRRVHAASHGPLSGDQELTWDGRDDRGQEADTGIYWVRVRAGDEAHIRRVVRIK
ncbi:MAG: FlgD immunoglobulin-like domain containing protein [Candidatus Eisenbacteria bacterium]